MPASFEVKKLVADWVICVYDLPVGQDDETRRRNNAFRAYWIYNARKIGAVPHTESVYVMPYTVEGIKLAKEIAEKAGGQVYIFQSKLTNPREARDFTTRYDGALEEYFEELEQRMKEAEEAVTDSELDARAVVQRLRGAEHFVSMCDEVIARRGDKTLETRFRAYQVYIQKVRQSYERRREERDAAIQPATPIQTFQRIDFPEPKKRDAAKA